ncbi:MAG TPA: SDR family oxidoreductase [Polyangiaceae bacterium]|nr:SDR family oxidoreductase [Polyangiaceae bacterium]
MPQNEGPLNGKVMIVTGPTSGIGEVTAKELARRGAHVVLVCRSRDKGDTLRSEITRNGGTATLVLSDFESLADVRRAATEILEKVPKIDVLVNNAGAIQTERRNTKDGIELTFGVNHLAPFLFTNLLLDRLKASAPSRIVNVASRAHKRGGFDLEDVEMKKGYVPFVAYCRSKLANVLFTYELARRLEGTTVTTNALHPGVIASGFGRNTPGTFKTLVRIAAPFMWTPEKGAQTSLKLATDPSLAAVTGKYFDEKGRETRSSDLSYDVALQKGLWALSERMTGLA